MNHDEYKKTAAGSTAHPSRRWVTRAVALLAAASALFLGGKAMAAYPERPIRMLVAYAPGGSTDVLARMFAQELSTKLGQSVVVENKAGGGTLIGTQQVIRANSDGYTLLFGSPATVITPLLYANPPYDVLEDLSPVSMATVQSMGVLASSAKGFSSVADLISYAKANPGAVNFASSGNGSAQHLSAEALSEATGIKMTHIPYKGAGVAITDLLAGRVDLMITSLVDSMMENVKNGTIKLLATTGPARAAAMPNVPTVAESGVPGFSVTTFTAIYGPKGMPQEAADTIGAAMKEIQAEGKIQKLIETQAMDVRASSTAQMAEFMAKEKAFYSGIIVRTKASRD
ncbi:Bug family tripartite tricarboxylate transporter substrate binding protein [Paracandidimonas lactea]|uniref:Bug family tripartite tricarboxylate transporter substrate binding protein n=1 Tax=Paracandidimonas lactea TaxID=2895524 RepID=UPI001F299BED|nr:tripartite tricarboxylate transporter substrate binding protein [Paracandidimonas lactea]